jgi:hypothetical protein
MSADMIRELLAVLPREDRVERSPGQVAILRGAVAEADHAAADVWVAEHDGRIVRWPQRPEARSRGLRPGKLMERAVQHGDAYYVLPEAALADG